MPHKHPSGFLTNGLQLLLSTVLTSWLLLIGPVAHASSVTQQASSSKCPTIPANFDYVHASKQQLHQYLLPAAPPVSDTQAYSDWKSSVEATLHGKGICVNDEQTLIVSNNGHPVRSAPLLVNCVTSAPPGTQCRTNWNGYFAGDGSQPGYNEIVGKWNVECVNISQSPSDSLQSSWVGLGGVDEGNLWQAGSGWSTLAGYYLWYEAVGPGDPGEIEFGFPNCGDHIYVDLWFAPNDPSSNVAFYMTDNGTPYRYSARSGFTSGYLTADWIDERPACGYDQYGNAYLYQLADYNYSEWTDAEASPNNPTAGFYSIGQLPHTRVWMEDSNGTQNRIAWTDYLGSETGSGSDNYRAYWENNGTASQPCM